MKRSPLQLFSKLSIQSKLLSILLLVSLTSILVTGYISYTSSSSTLISSILSNLSTLRNNQASQIESYFDSTQKNVLTLSESPFVAEALKSFKAAYAQLSTQNPNSQQQQQLETYYRDQLLPRLSTTGESQPIVETYLPQAPAAKYLQYYYTANSRAGTWEDKAKFDNANDGSEYSQIHASINPLFRNIAERFNYGDIFLVDAESGNVVYTLYKGVDFGTNLRQGPYASTNLAKVFQEIVKARDPSFVTAVDFERYRPSEDQPTSFLGTTVFDGTDFLGALIFEAPVDEVNRIVNSEYKWKTQGLGETGETLLVGSDKQLRAIPRFEVQSPEAYYKSLQEADIPTETVDRIRESSSILALEAGEEAVELALAGEEGAKVYSDYAGTSVLGAYQPIQLGNFNWGLVTKINTSEVFAPVNDLTRRLLATTAILVPIVTLLSIWLSRVFLRPIKQLIQATRRLAAGEPQVKVNVSSKDEFRVLADSFNLMSQSLYDKEQALQEKINENDRLLLNILPAPAAQRLKGGDKEAADSFTNLSVLFAEVEGFNELSDQLPAEQSVTLLNELVGAFDDAAEDFRVEKLKTMGASYLAVCGLSDLRVDHAKRTVDFAIEMLKIVHRFNQQHQTDLSLDIGVHSGSVVGGIVGKSKFIYEVWGDTINIARTIHQSPDRNVIRVTEPVQQALQNLYAFEQVEGVKLKGGVIPVWSVKDGYHSSIAE